MFANQTSVGKRVIQVVNDREKEWSDVGGSNDEDSDLITGDERRTKVIIFLFFSFLIKPEMDIDSPPL